MLKVTEGENAWITDNGNIYLCKVLKATTNGKVRKFFIHFMGWAAKYDCWADEHTLAHQNDAVGKERLLKSITATGPPPAKERKNNKRAVAEDVPKDSAEVEDLPPSSSTHTNRKILTEEGQIAAKKRRKALAEQDLIDEYSGIDSEYVVRIPVPLVLKSHLVDEWSLITATGKRLVSLPRKNTVKKIFEEYLDEKEKKCTAEMFDAYKDLFDSFQIFFDKSLPYVLLYRQEREQFDAVTAILGESFLPSDVYGGEHLLRLFVRIQRSLSHVFIDTNDMNGVIQKLTEFLKWLDKNRDRYLIIAEYILAEESLESIRSKTVDDFFGNLHEKEAESVIPQQINGSPSPSTKSLKKIKSEFQDDVQSSSSNPTETSPVGRPVRTKAGKNKNYDSE